MSLIFLIGLPGVGKTYWARKLSEEYGLPFTDLDEHIERNAGITIPAIFETEGEAAFRQRETEALAGIIHEAERCTVVACGGGTPVFHDNMERMKAAGTTIYLKASILYILRNIASENHRPLLKETDVTATMEALLAERQSWYEKADHILDAENLSVATFAKIIARCTDRP